jgi:hypothetical protein
MGLGKMCLQCLMRNGKYYVLTRLFFFLYLVVEQIYDAENSPVFFISVILPSFYTSDRAVSCLRTTLHSLFKFCFQELLSCLNWCYKICFMNMLTWNEMKNVPDFT